MSQLWETKGILSVEIAAMPLPPPVHARPRPYEVERGERPCRYDFFTCLRHISIITTVVWPFLSLGQATPRSRISQSRACPSRVPEYIA